MFGGLTEIDDTNSLVIPEIRTYRSLRDVPIEYHDYEHLYDWLRAFVGVSLSRQAVCEGHNAPFDAFSDIYFEKPPNVLILGSRGSGKSMMSAFQAHLACRQTPRHAARIMGGSKQQSGQIYTALNDFIVRGGDRVSSDADTIKYILREAAEYVNGSEIKMLAASTKSGRGPHVPDLFLDELDEIKTEIFESAIGMAQSREGSPTRIIMTSTWHNEAGLMGKQIEQARQGKFPFYTFCVFEVLERCPSSLSGPKLENCPKCPIVQWCHEDMDGYGNGIPKAKRAGGHYPIEDFIQKAAILSERSIEADFLCRGPKAEGIWFRSFNARANVAEPSLADPYRAEFHPDYRTHLPIDYGVCTGAVAFQIRKRYTLTGIVEDMHIFGDYYSDSVAARDNAVEIARHFKELMKGRDVNSDKVRLTMDPAGGDKNALGSTGLAEYNRGGIHRIHWWPRMQHKKYDALTLIETFIKTGDGQRHLFINPRCKATIDAFRNYRRKKRHDVWLPEPEDPQHPYEEMIDSLAGGLLDIYPKGREIPGQKEPRASARKLLA